MRRVLNSYKYGIIFAIFFGLLFPGIAYLVQTVPAMRDRLAPASDWIEVIEAKVLDYDPETAVITYQWHRDVKKSLTVQVFIDLVATGDEDLQPWSAFYGNVFYQQGEYNFVDCVLEEFPDLPPGVYLLQGMICFTTELGNRKKLEFEFEPYVVVE